MGLLRLLFAPRGLFAATGIAAAGLVCGGLILAHTLNLAACPLCILQRMLYLLLALEAVAAWLLAGSGSMLARRTAAFVMAATAATGAGIAAYQTRTGDGTDAAGPATAPRYRIHRLTITFLQTEILARWDGAE